MTFPNHSDFPDGLFTGTRAITSQTYIEANVKNGLQFEFSSLNTSLAAGASQSAIFLTGNKTVIIKSREIQYTGQGISAQVFEGTTYTGGTAGTIFNLNRINTATSTAQIISGVTVTLQGTAISATTYGVGSIGNGQTSVGSFTVQGIERILKPNTAYLLQITNLDTVACKIATYATWYEGTPDLPVP